MTHIVVTKNGEDISSIECSGHTGYACEGEDIVCAAISSIIQTAVLGVLMLAKVDAEVKKDDGYLLIKIPKNLSEDRKRDCNLLLNAAILGVSDIREEYSDYIELEVK